MARDFADRIVPQTTTESRHVNFTTLRCCNALALQRWRPQLSRCIVPASIIHTTHRFRNDLYCVGWGVKLYLLTNSPDILITAVYSPGLYCCCPLGYGVRPKPCYATAWIFCSFEVFTNNIKSPYKVLGFVQELVLIFLVNFCIRYTRRYACVIFCQLLSPTAIQ